MAEHGFEGATIARIVAEAQVPLSSVYHYFGSKDGVLLNVVERGAHRLLTALSSHPVPQGSRLEKLTVFAKALESELEKAPAFLGLMMSVAITPGAFNGSGTQEVVREARAAGFSAIRDGLSRIFELEPECETNLHLSRYVLANIDGAVFARKSDDVPVRSILTHLPAAVIGIHDSLVSRDVVES